MAQATSPQLSRKLGLTGATFIGLGSMIGAGVFSAFAPAAQSAGLFVLVALVIAGSVAFLNAASSAQLAQAYPTSGGTYAFGRNVLGPWWGFIAGWSFVVGKSASAAAIALTFAAYVVPAMWQKPLAMGVVALFTVINLRGITRTAQVAAILVIPVVVVLLGLAVTNVSGTTPAPLAGSEQVNLYGVLQASGLLFFAFAGYARITTLGEEVINPTVTIKRAIALSLGLVSVLYLLFGASMMWVLGPDELAQSTQPAIDAARASGNSWAIPFVLIAVGLAALGSLLALIAGMSRTVFAMARENDLPRGLSAVDEKANVPHRAEIAVGIVVIMVVLVADLRGAIGFSSAGVLLYYFVANISAWRQPRSQQGYPRWMPVTGALLCVVLIVTLPLLSILIAGAVIVCGIAYRMLRLALMSRKVRSKPGQ
jgi:APA family basic amino acid/polyamine antiporter